MQELEAHSGELPPIFLVTLNFRIYGACSHTFLFSPHRNSSGGITVLILVMDILRQNGYDMIIVIIIAQIY